MSESGPQMARDNKYKGRRMEKCRSSASHAPLWPPSGTFCVRSANMAVLFPERTEATGTLDTGGVENGKKKETPPLYPGGGCL